MRLMGGVLAGQSFNSVLMGSDQLQRRPMARVVEPLRQMGAHIIGREHGRLAPLTFAGQALHGYRHTPRIASAQVKSALLLAGLFASSPTTVVEPGPARDHSERMLKTMGAPLSHEGAAITVKPLDEALQPLDITIPGDISSAAFLIVAATLQPNAALVLEGVGTNPTRTGLLDALDAMGACIERRNPRTSGGEPIADLAITPASLHGIELGGEQIVTMIDEIPIFALAATQAEGRTIVRDAAELRVKETDRIATTVDSLKALGANIQATPDGMIIEGPTPLKGAEVTSYDDHRLAMMLSIAGGLAEGETLVRDAHVAADSFPGFAPLLQHLGATITPLPHA